MVLKVAKRGTIPPFIVMDVVRAANAREALRELEQDAAEGADLLMVKPALAYLDVLARARLGDDPVLAHASGQQDDQGAGGRAERRDPAGVVPRPEQPQAEEADEEPEGELHGRQRPEFEIPVWEVMEQAGREIMRFRRAPRHPGSEWTKVRSRTARASL